MRTPPCILVVDDQPMNVDILRTRLAVQGYEVLTALDGPTAVAIATSQQPDLLLLDIRLPTMDGLAVCRVLKADATLPFIPIILLTAKIDTREVVEGLDAGADDYLTKPVDQAALLARVKAMLRVKARYDTMDAQAQAQAAQAAYWAAWSQTLEQRLQRQITELERLGRLKPFLAPPLAEVVLSAGGASFLQRQQRSVTVVCCVLQGIATFVATAMPAQVLAVLQAYDAVVGPAIAQWEGTVEQVTEAHVRVVFNAPLPCTDPAGRAVQMALALREALAPMRAYWQAQHYAVALGIGIAQGDAILGVWRGAGRLDYAVLGPVTAVATALGDAAADGQILLTPAVAAAVAGRVPTMPVVLRSPPHALSGDPVLQVDQDRGR